MSTTIFVLIMIFGGSPPQSGFAVITQEFNSFETCEQARKHLEKSQTSVNVIRSQGCHKK
jgi:hypothetical protein